MKFIDQKARDIAVASLSISEPLYEHNSMHKEFAIRRTKLATNTMANNLVLLNRFAYYNLSQHGALKQFSSFTAVHSQSEQNLAVKPPRIGNRHYFHIGLLGDTKTYGLLPEQAAAQA